MRLSRRGLLGRGALLAGAGLTGCLSGGSNVNYPSTETAESAPSAASNAPDAAIRDGTATPEDSAGGGSDAADVPVPHSELGGEVARIYDELTWFAVTHPEAMAAYREAVERAANRVAALRRRDGFGEAELAALNEEITVATSIAATRIGDHFRTDEMLKSETDFHVDVVTKFARRGDLDRVDEELRRLETFLRGVATEEYTRHEMSREPIRNRLHGWLRRDWRRPLALDVATSESKGIFDALVYGNRDVLLSQATLPSRIRERLSGVFDPLEHAEGRTGRVLVTPILLPTPADLGMEDVDREDWTPPDPEPHVREFVRRHRTASLEDLTVTAVRLQRYDSVAAATQARRSLVDEGPIREELSYRFGARGEKWRRIYYEYAGDVWYAYLIQAGPFLLTTGASQTSWEERVDWAEPLRRTWLWRPAPEETETAEGDAA